MRIWWMPLKNSLRKRNYNYCFFRTGWNCLPYNERGKRKSFNGKHGTRIISLLHSPRIWQTRWKTYLRLLACFRNENITLPPLAYADYIDWKKTDKKLFLKITSLIREAAKTPGDGTGKPELLACQNASSGRLFYSGQWWSFSSNYLLQYIHWKKLSLYLKNYNDSD